MAVECSLLAGHELALVAPVQDPLVNFLLVSHTVLDNGYALTTQLTIFIKFGVSRVYNRNCNKLWKHWSQVIFLKHDIFSVWERSQNLGKVEPKYTRLLNGFKTYILLWNSDSNLHFKKIKHIDVNRINKVGNGNNGTFNKKTWLACQKPTLPCVVWGIWGR